MHRHVRRIVALHGDCARAGAQRLERQPASGKHLHPFAFLLGDDHASVAYRDSGRTKKQQLAGDGVAILQCAERGLECVCGSICTRLEHLNAGVAKVRDIDRSVDIDGDAFGVLKLAVAAALRAKRREEVTKRIEHVNPVRLGLGHQDPAGRRRLRAINLDVDAGLEREVRVLVNAGGRRREVSKRES